MRLLIDSNVFLWTSFEPARLSRLAREAVLDPGNQLVVSLVTPLELGIAVSKGRLDLGVSLREFYLDQMETLDAEELAILRPHALAATALPYIHKDPMDRILAAQAIVEGLPIVTSDRRIAELGVQVVW